MENVNKRTKAVPSSLLIGLAIISLMTVLWVAKEFIVGMLIIVVAVALGAYLLLKTGSMVITILLTLFFASTKLLTFILAVGSIFWLLSLF